MKFTNSHFTEKIHHRGTNDGDDTGNQNENNDIGKIPNQEADSRGDQNKKK